MMTVLRSTELPVPAEAGLSPRSPSRTEIPVGLHATRLLGTLAPDALETKIPAQPPPTFHTVFPVIWAPSEISKKIPGPPGLSWTRLLLNVMSRQAMSHHNPGPLLAYTSLPSTSAFVYATIFTPPASHSGL